jgi:hypothetical protein
VSEERAGTVTISYRNLLRDVLYTGSAEIERVQKELQVVRDRVTGTTERAALQAVQGRLTALLAAFSKVDAHAEAAGYCADLLPDGHLSVAELAGKSSSEALELLPGIAKQLEILWAAVSHLSDAAQPAPDEEHPA